MGNLDRKSRFLSLILRHKPETIGTSLDEHGLTDVDDVLDGMGISRDTLDEIVRTDAKGRYEYNDTGNKIRARQGHSVDVDVELEEKEPPDILYHGTTARFMSAIQTAGIIPMSRKYVHLSVDKETASKVGARHGKPVILEIKAKQMYKDGNKFYLSRNGVWLTDSVKPEYLHVYWGNKDGV